MPESPVLCPVCDSKLYYVDKDRTSLRCETDAPNMHVFSVGTKGDFYYLKAIEGCRSAGGCEVGMIFDLERGVTP